METVCGTAWGIEERLDETRMAVEVEVIDDPAVIRDCCAAAESRHNMLVCCRCEDSTAAVAAIVILPAEVKRGYPFCGSCYQGFSIIHQA